MSSKSSKNKLDIFDANLDLTKVKIGIVTAEWNNDITGKLKSSCHQKLIDLGITEDHIISCDVPGSYELPLGAKWMLGQENVDAVICLGCVIQGETKHDDYINQSVANGIMSLNIGSSKPVIFGVLTTNTHEQAIARAGGDVGDKGIESAVTAIQMLHIKKGISENKSRIGFN